MNDLYKSLCDVLGTACKRIGLLIYHNPVPILAGVVAVTLSVVMWNSYRESSVRQITVFVGTPGTSSYRIKDRVSSAIEGASLVPGYKYQVNVVPTQGYIDIKDRLERDTTGNAIGMLVDGMNSPELRTLLPMDWDYLHILARVDFLEACRDRADPAKKAPLPRQFSEIVPHLKYGTVYAGPESSGTRKFAELLFDKHQLGRDRKVLQEVLAPGLMDWTQAIVAFKEGKIDLAFYCGPLGATTIEQICDDRSAVLLDIKELRSSLIKADSYSVIEGSIPKHYYSAAPFVKTRVTADDENSTTIIETRYQPAVYFNGDDVATIAARRLIVTSKKMTESDAFAITRALAKTLIETRDVPEDTWLRKSPDLPPVKEKGDFGIALHDGAKLIRDDQSLARWWNPATWNKSLLVFLSGFFAVALTAALQQLAKRISEPAAQSGSSGQPERRERPTAPPPPPAAVAVTVSDEPTDVSQFRTLFARYSQIRKRLDVLVTPTPAECDSLVAELLELHEAIDSAETRHEITTTQARELMFDWRELKRDIQLLKAAPVPLGSTAGATAPQPVD